MKRRNAPNRGRPSHRRRIAASALTIETKWGWGPALDQGWCAVPAALLRCAAGLGISAEEGWLLIQLLDLKWSDGHPTLETLCDRGRLNPERLHALLRTMEGRGLLKLIPKPARRRSASDATGLASNSGGWEVDLAPLLRTLDDYIMRGGDLSAGYLRLAPAGNDADRPP